MARRTDIPIAFDTATLRDTAGRYTISTRDFIHELVKLNHHFSPGEANDWIAQYKPGWRVHTEGDYGFHVFARFNPN